MQNLHKPKTTDRYQIKGLGNFLCVPKHAEAIKHIILLYETHIKPLQCLTGVYEAVASLLRIPQVSDVGYSKSKQS